MGRRCFQSLDWNFQVSDCVVMSFAISQKPALCRIFPIHLGVGDVGPGALFLIVWTQLHGLACSLKCRCLRTRPVSLAF